MVFEEKLLHSWGVVSEEMSLLHSLGCGFGGNVLWSDKITLLVLRFKENTTRILHCGLKKNSLFFWSQK